MSPNTDPKAAQWATQIMDTIADSSAVREGLHDDEAIPLMDWGAQQAEQLAARLAATDTPAPDEERIGNVAYALQRLMTRITWLAVYRHKKDAAWLTRTFNTINDLSLELYGPDAPQLSDQEIAAWIAANSGAQKKANGDLVKELIARLTPPAASQQPLEASAAAPGEPPAPPENPPQPPPAPSMTSLRDALAHLFGPPRADQPPEPPTPQGETHDDPQT